MEEETKSQLINNTSCISENSPFFICPSSGMIPSRQAATFVIRFNPNEVWRTHRFLVEIARYRADAQFFIDTISENNSENEFRILVTIKLVQVC